MSLLHTGGRNEDLFLSIQTLMLIVIAMTNCLREENGIKGLKIWEGMARVTTDEWLG